MNSLSFTEDEWKQFLLYKKLFGRLKHNQLLNDFNKWFIHLITDDGLYDQKASYNVKIVFIYPQIWEFSRDS